jgi:hypothetical protein
MLLERFIDLCAELLKRDRELAIPSLTPSALPGEAPLEEKLKEDLAQELANLEKEMNSLFGEIAPIPSDLE